MQRTEWDKFLPLPAARLKKMRPRLAGQSLIVGAAKGITRRRKAHGSVSLVERRPDPGAVITPAALAKSWSLKSPCGANRSWFAESLRFALLVRRARRSGPDPTRKENQRRPDQAGAPKHPEAIEKAQE